MAQRVGPLVAGEREGDLCVDDRPAVPGVEWLRSAGAEHVDGVIDFDAVIRDPLDPDWIDLRFDAGDNLHPNSTGYELMASSIPQECLDDLADH